MGRSAKVHKRVSKKGKSSTSNQPAAVQTEQLQASKKKATLKDKRASKSTSGPERKEGEHVLGGADYVSLLMGGRKKAREEGAKLPRGD